MVAVHLNSLLRSMWVWSALFAVNGAACAVGGAASNGGSAVTAAAGDAIRPAARLPAGVLRPRGYLKASDSPFAGLNFEYFYLEDFEDHLLNTPGVTADNSRVSSTFGAELIDSVDGDDGLPGDNKCQKAVGTCDAWWAEGSVRFTFDATVLGALPTHVGVVWTDGAGEVSFEAFGPTGASLYQFGPFSEPGFPDSSILGTTAEDRFFGVVAPGGVAAIVIKNTAGGIEVDHLQYGRARSDLQ